MLSERYGQREAETGRPRAAGPETYGRDRQGEAELQPRPLEYRGGRGQAPSCAGQARRGRGAKDRSRTACPARSCSQAGTGASSGDVQRDAARTRSEEHTSELQSLMRISYAVFCLKKKNIHTKKTN